MFKSAIRRVFPFLLLILLGAMPVARALQPIPGIVDANIFVNLSKKMVPSVVNISTLTTVKGHSFQDNPDDILKKFFGELFRQYPNRGGEEDEEDALPEPAPG